MFRYFIELSFRGTNYHGWQVQPNAVSVQSMLNDVLSVLAKEEIHTTGAGRTDTGVHAQFFVAHFDTQVDFLNRHKDPLYKINAILPQDISVRDIYLVKKNIHARYSAISRTYSYTISQCKDPFMLDFSWYYPAKLDIDMMNEACLMLLKNNDFTSFSKLHSNVRNNFCHIIRAEWLMNNEQLVFTIEADRFLRNMVRAITGTLLEIGTGSKTIEEFIAIIKGRNRSLAGTSVPAHGLKLIHISYPNNIRL